MLFNCGDAHFELEAFVEVGRNIALDDSEIVRVVIENLLVIGERGFHVGDVVLGRHALDDKTEHVAEFLERRFLGHAFEASRHIQKSTGRGAVTPSYLWGGEARRRTPLAGVVRRLRSRMTGAGADANFMLLDCARSVSGTVGEDRFGSFADPALSTRKSSSSRFSDLTSVLILFPSPAFGVWTLSCAE
jgi:hypothetical protein